MRKMILIITGLIILAGIHFTQVGMSAETRGDKQFTVGYKVLDLQYRDGKPLTVAVWYPTTAAPQRFHYGGPTNGTVAPDAAPDPAHGPYPLLVFSHGFGGSGLSSVFFTERLAARGWIVAAPDHSDRYSAVRIRTGQNENFDRKGFRQYAEKIAESDADHRDEYLYRIDEMKFVLDQLLQSPLFGNRIDVRKIAVGGHSFGAFTALGLCGTVADRSDDRIKAVLLFSSGSSGCLYRESELLRVKMPSMYLLGEREKDQKRGTRTMDEIARKVYQSMSPPKYLLHIKGANHFSFNNRFSNRLGARLLSGSEDQFELINRYSIAFLEKYVAGKPDGVLEQQDRMLTRYQKEL